MARTVDWLAEREWNEGGRMGWLYAKKQEGLFVKVKKRRWMMMPSALSAPKVNARLRHQGLGHLTLKAAFSFSRGCSDGQHGLLERFIVGSDRGR